MIWVMIDAMDRFAPNGVVRRRVRKIDEKYREVIGEPTALMKHLSKTCDKLAKNFKKKDAIDPFNRHHKEEPFKRYTYTKDKTATNGDVPYTTEWPTRRSFDIWAKMTWEDIKFRAAVQAAKAVRMANPGKGDPDIDPFIMETMKERNFLTF